MRPLLSVPGKHELIGDLDRVEITIPCCLQEAFSVIWATGSCAIFGNESEESGLTRHDSARRPIGFRNLVSNWCQTAPILPVFPIHTVDNHLSVNNLRSCQFHGMEEVVGSIPTRSTSQSDDS
jgi:hypothetical protein